MHALRPDIICHLVHRLSQDALFRATFFLLILLIMICEVQRFFVKKVRLKIYCLFNQNRKI